MPENCSKSILRWDFNVNWCTYLPACKDFVSCLALPAYPEVFPTTCFSLHPVSSIALYRICINYGAKNNLPIHILANAKIVLCAYANKNPVILTCKP